MVKIIFTFLLLFMPLYSQTINFYEEKYYDALETTFNTEGDIIFAGEKIQILYDDHTILTYTGHFLYTEKEGKTTKINLDKKPEVKMFFILFKAIYFNKQEVLDRYFMRQGSKDIVVLLPKENVSPYITIVRYQKVKKRLNFLEIKLTNKDWIRIEEHP